MPEQPDTQPETPEARFRSAMRHILSVSKPEILKREAEDKEHRQKERGNGDGNE